MLCKVAALMFSSLRLLIFPSFGNQYYKCVPSVFAFLFYVSVLCVPFRRFLARDDMRL
jgi:hypothetical protein